MRSDRAPLALRAVVAVTLAIAVVAAIPMALVYVPAYTRSLAAATGAPELSGLPEPVALAAAEDVRRVVAGGSENALPERVDGREGFGASERSHLADVREVVAFGRAAGLVAALVCAAGAALLARRWGTGTLRSAGRWAGFGLLGFIALAALAGASDFDWLFERFHGLFFAEGTWTFPYSSLLIQLFPTAFWAVSGALWAGGCGAVAAVLLVLGRRQVTEEV